MKHFAGVAGHTMGTPEYTLNEAVDLFGEIGLDGIEIIWDDDYICALRKEASPGELRALGKRIADQGLKLCCLTPYMTQIDATDAAVRGKDVQDFRRCIAVAEELGAPLIRVYGGAYNPDTDADNRLNLEGFLVESLRSMGEAAEGTGVTLAVETHFSTLTCSAAETSALVRKTDHPKVRVLYDQPNLEFSDCEEYREALELLNGLIVFAHVKDLVYKEGISGGFKSSKVVTVDESERRISSRIPGEGIIPWPEILPALKARGYAGWLSLEYERRWYPYDLPDAREGMKKGRDYVYHLVERL